MINELMKYGNFQSVGKNQNKKQIILTNTSRNVKDYLQSLKYRYNGKYDKIPNYIVTRDGKILQLLENDEYGKYNGNKKVDENSIVISLENLGWLEKEPLKNSHINWIGDIYNQKVFERKWRDYFFWQPYTDKQIETLSVLVNQLCTDFNIPTTFIGHNVKVDKIEKFHGIASYSNYYRERTDLNPSFNFEEFIKIIENE
jgi:N-acetyl-anhydromuramyl-L-alanine amidase AmpD